MDELLLCFWIWRYGPLLKLAKQWYYRNWSWISIIVIIFFLFLSVFLQNLMLCLYIAPLMILRERNIRNHYINNSYPDLSSICRYYLAFDFSEVKRINGRRWNLYCPKDSGIKCWEITHPPNSSSSNCIATTNWRKSLGWNCDVGVEQANRSRNVAFLQF